jgi:hypothetical protein
LAEPGSSMHLFTLSSAGCPQSRNDVLLNVNVYDSEVTARSEVSKVLNYGTCVDGWVTRNIGIHLHTRAGSGTEKEILSSLQGKAGKIL